MNRMAEQIKQLVTIRDALEMYNLPVGRNGRIPCPIHNGKDPNFSYNDKVYQCWSCGAKGDVISFVRMYFNLGFGQALVRLNNDFRLGLTNEKPNAKSRAIMAERAEKRRQEKERLDMFKSAYLRVAGAHARLMRLGSNPELLSRLESWLDDNLEMAVVR